MSYAGSSTSVIREATPGGGVAAMRHRPDTAHTVAHHVGSELIFYTSGDVLSYATARLKHDTSARLSR
jgi:hypothetical protein